MASELDLAFQAAMAALTGEGSPARTARDAEGRAVAAALPDTLGGFFRAFASRHGAIDGLVAGEERLSFAALDALSEELARALAGSAIGRGDRVAIAMRNCPAWVLCYMAVAKTGGIAVLMNGWWTPAELAHGLDLTAPVLTIADGPRADRIRTSNWVGRLACLPVERPIAEALAPLLDGPRADLPDIAGDDDATILFTSGSTGDAKGAVATHRSVTTGVYCFMTMTAGILDVFHGGDRANLPGAPAILVGTPLFHVTGEVPTMLNSFALGRKMVLMAKWDAGEALRLIEREGVSYFIGVPTMSLELMQHPDRDRRDTRTLLDIVAGGAPRPVAHVPRLKEAFPHANPMLGYGLTETNAVGCTNYRASYLAKPASTGRAQWPWVEVAIFADGNPLPRGEIGEVGLRSAANARGYWNNPAATARAFTADGYFLTGDLGYLDADDYLFIVDRAKDIIIRGGENIACLEVEAALYAHPAVAEASVFGLPDERLGEVPAAAVRLEPGAPLARADLEAFLAARLARFKLPARLWIEAAPLPKLGTGKIDKKALRTRYAAEVA